MEICVQLSCPCRPGFMYKNKESLHQHKRTKLHKMWEASQDHKQDRIRSKEFENEIERLKQRLTHKENIEKELLARIHYLEEERDYWKSHLDGIYVN